MTGTFFAPVFIYFSQTKERFSRFSDKIFYKSFDNIKKVPLEFSLPGYAESWF